MHVTASTPPAMAGKCIRIRRGQVKRAARGRPGRSAVRGRNSPSPSHGSPTRSHHRPRHLFIASHTIILCCVGMQRVRVLYWGGVRAYCSGRDNSAYCSREGVRALVLWRPCVLFWKDSAATHALLPQHGAPRQPRRARGPLPKQAGLLASCYWIGHACAPVWGSGMRRGGAVCCTIHQRGNALRCVAPPAPCGHV